MAKRKTRGKLSGDVRREQIVQAALRIIARKGVSGLTTAGIAKEVGVSEANLYRHFKNKDEILYATGRSIGGAIRRNLELAFKDTAPPFLRLKKAFRRHLDYIENNEGIPRLAFSEEMHISNAKLRKVFLNNISMNASALEALLREVQGAGAMRPDVDPRATATMIMGMMMITIMRWSLSGFSFSLSAEGKRLWKNLETCIGTNQRKRGRPGT